MRFLVSALLVLAPAVTGAQTSWIPLARVGTPTIEGDTASSRPHDGHLDVWIRQGYSTPQRLGTLSKSTVVYQKSLGKWSIDCGRRRYRVSHVVYHAADDRVVADFDGAEERIAWQEPERETIGEIVVDSVCASPSLFDGSYTAALTAYYDRMQQIDSIRAAACAAEQPSTIVTNCRRLADVKGTTTQSASERWALRSQIDAQLEIAWPAFPHIVRPR
jgi:hypothetical protein